MNDLKEMHNSSSSDDQSNNDIESLQTNQINPRKLSKVKILTITVIILVLLNITSWILLGITNLGITKNSEIETIEKIKTIEKNNTIIKHLQVESNPELVAAKAFAEYEMNTIRGKTDKFKLNPEFNLSSNVLSLSKDNFTWSKHRQFCRDEVEKNSYRSYQIVENKLLTQHMFQSKQFADYVQENNADINELLNELMPKRYYKLSIDDDIVNNKEAIKDYLKKEKEEFLNGVCTNIISETDSEFVYKAVHLSANAGVYFMDKSKWNAETDKYTCEKLWEDLVKVLNDKVDEKYSVAKNQETNEALNPGVVIENRFPVFEGCGNGFPVAEIKILTLWGRVIQAVDACNKYKPVYRFRDGSFVVSKWGNYKVSETDLKIQKSIDMKWDLLVKWSEIISNYIGADRLRIDWFHKNGEVQFNELGYPGANQHWHWNKMYSDILYDGYKDKVYEKRNYKDLINMDN